MPAYLELSLLLALNSLLALNGLTQVSGVVRVHQPQIQFTVSTPSGWRSDPQSASEMNLIGAFHPDDAKWKSAPVVMYVNLSFKTDSNQTLDQVIEADALNFQKLSMGVKIEEQEKMRTFLQQKNIRIVSYLGGENDNYEQVAYIDEGLHVVMIVIGARSQENLDKSLSAFHKLALSYFDLKQGCCLSSP